ncbi:MAG: hypothetical protein FWE36_00230 [Erysipelotrichales bacterium]|nr:hypothetical protein [Erysipelotrichales bacterium]
MKKLGIFILIILLGALVACAPSSSETRNEDFRLTISVDKTRANMKDIIEMTAILENLSGEDIRIKTINIESTSLSDIFFMALYPGMHDVGLSQQEDGPSNELIIGSNEIVRNTQMLSIERWNEFWDGNFVQHNQIRAGIEVNFYMGEDFTERIILIPRAISIRIRG